jgi:hypothetical protein
LLEGAVIENIRRFAQQPAILSGVLQRLEGVRAETGETQVTEPTDVQEALSKFDPLWEQLATWEKERFIRALVATVKYDGRTENVTVGFHSEHQGALPTMSTAALVEIQFPLRPKPPTTPAVAQTELRSAGRLPQATRALALAIYFDEMIRNGDARDYADIARQTCLCRERVSQIVRLNYLAPNIQIELLYLPPVSSGRYPISETALRKIASLLSWSNQRQEWGRLKQVHRLA